MKLFNILILTTTILFANQPWNKENLYDDKTNSYYIPYELWTGENWDGEKKLRFNEVNKKFMDNKSITGPENYYHKKLNKNIQIYKRTNKSKVQLFTFYDYSIARVYDTRKDRYFDSGAKFPAGFNWKLNELKNFEQTEWKKDKIRTRTLGIKIIDLSFDSSNNLKKLTYEFYVKGDLDHTYTYEPNKGMISLLKH